MADNVVKFVKGDRVQYVGDFVDESDLGTVIHVEKNLVWVHWGNETWGDGDSVVPIEDIEYRRVSIEVPADVAEALAAGKYYLEDQKTLTAAAKAALKEANGD